MFSGTTTDIHCQWGSFTLPFIGQVFLAMKKREKEGKKARRADLTKMTAEQ